MGKLKDLTGLTFGRLTVVEKAPSRVYKTSTMAMWVCHCECGATKTVYACSLTSGHTTSCGCYQRELTSRQFVKDLSGHKYGRLTVVGRDPTAHSDDAAYWICRCDCGTTAIVMGTKLTRGHTKSCGCYQREIAQQNGISNRKHGATDTPEFNVWQGMLERCHNPNHPAWKHYGGRGITVCAEWKRDFAAFRRDLGPRPSPKHSIERVDNNGNYSPANCVWATPKEQANNKRNNHMITYRGETRTLVDWARRVGISDTGLRDRLGRLGWSIEEALTRPNRYARRNASTVRAA